MAYKLTQKDIDEYNLQGALVGEEATPEDLRIMDQGLIGAMQSAIDAAPDTIQVQPAAISAPAVDGPQIGDPQFTETSEQAAAREAALATVSPAQVALLGAGADDVSQDPYSNLSRTQRMMLAFSAIKDAGMALQGQEGRAFSDTMKSFNEMRDMERKRQAQLARQNALNELLGLAGGGAVAGGETMLTPELYQSKRETILRAMLMGAIDGASGNAALASLDKQMETQQTQQKVEAAREQEQAFLQPQIENVMSFINPEGQVDDEGNPVINPMLSNVLTRGAASAMEVGPYRNFENQLNNIRSTLTFKNMIDLKERGVTFGGLAVEEIKMVSGLAGTLDPADPVGTMQNLRRIDNIISGRGDTQGAEEISDEDLIKKYGTGGRP